MSDVEIIKILNSENESELTRLTANIIRVLTIYHGVCWKTELPEDLLKFYKVMGDEPLNLDLLDEAINYLEAKGIIVTEYRKRGEILNKNIYVDKLVKLKDLDTILKVLQKDEVFIKYRFKRAEAIKKALNLNKE
ncbi:hypothetical protein KEJ20_05745 [Candidatus Bathyarchaeota archaeon]|nr:hypothetical protein [Candidatus Bathyarchaeota archaeon]